MRLRMLVLFFLLSALAQAEPRGLVAVLPLAETGGLKLTTAQRDLLEEAIRTQAAVALSSRGYTVLTGENTLRVLQENGVDPAKACEASCALDAAKELKASYFISGSINYVEGSYIVTLRMSESTAGRVLSSVRLRAEKMVAIADDFTAKADDFFARGLAGTEEGGVHVTAVTTSKAVEPVEKKASHSLPATIDVTVRSSLGESLDGAQIFVDGKVEGTAPRTLQIPSGDHTIRVEKELHFSKSINVSLRVADTQKLEFELKPDFGQIDITSRPTDATVSVDGISVGATPLKGLRLKTGSHVILVEKDQYLPVSQQLLVKPGPSQPLVVSLTADFGPLTVTSDPPGAEVLIDGTSAGTTPMTQERVAAGKHTLLLRLDPNAYEPVQQDVVVARGTGATVKGVHLPRREADVVITTQPPGATVTLDGVEKGKTSLKLRLLGGDYKLKLTRTGFAPFVRTLEVRPPEPLLIDLKLPKGGTGKGGRYTYADLGLEYYAVPEQPDLLPESREELRKEWTKNQFLVGGLGGGGVGLMTAYGILSGLKSSSSSSSESSAVNSTGVKIGVEIGAALVGATIGLLIQHNASQPTKVKVEDEDAIRANAETTRQWNARVKAAERHNSEVERQLQEANAEMGLDTPDE